MPQLFDVAVLVVFPVGFWLLWREVRALRVLVQVQKETLQTQTQAQASLGNAISALQGLVATFDPTRTLERIKATDDAVELVKTIEVRKIMAQSDEQKRQLLRALLELYARATSRLSDSQRTIILQMVKDAAPEIEAALLQIDKAAAGRATRYMLISATAISHVGEMFIKMASEQEERYKTGHISREEYQRWGRIAGVFKFFYAMVSRSFKSLVDSDPKTGLDGLLHFLTALNKEMQERQAELVAAVEGRDASQ